jgi:hypothetical protein
LIFRRAERLDFKYEDFASSSGRFVSSFISASSSNPLAQTPSITPATTSECRRHSAYPLCTRRTQGIHATRDPGIAEKAMHFFIF